jgi:hypothetical protein
MRLLHLHDGVDQVTSVGVVMLMRNNAEFIREYVLTGVFDRIDRLYPSCTFVYYLCENDSTDDTGELIDTLSQRKNTFVFRDNLPECQSFEEGEVSFELIQRIATVRNHFMNRIKHAPTFSSHQWLWFLDTDVYIDETCLAELMQHKPKLHNIGMLTCNSIDVFKDTDGGVFTNNHYYDTYPFIDTNNVHHYPKCIFPKCTNCNTKMDSEAKLPLVMDVRSAWGGCVLIDAHVFQCPRVKWLPTNLVTNDFCLCEHIYFCDSLTASTGKRIVVCTDVTCYYKVDERRFCLR